MADDDALRAVRAKRGYLLPHHGLMATAAPGLLEAYDQAYTQIALTARHLSEHDREFIWLAVLATTDEGLATHHIAKFRAAGGTDAMIGAAFTAAAMAIGGQAFDFAARDWGVQLAPFDARAAYLEACQGGAPWRLTLLALLGAMVCRRRERLLGWLIEAGYEASIPEDAMAEAMTLAMFPGSIPYFVRACGVWRALIVAGSVTASPRYAAWAAMTGQGGFDEASQ
ncbi:carboxymuconolactone decarboxylase family protein [Humitalea sp. 24SJ18S-53]|uniref:carboxymuconolactone decarboxylase family protein n=1 Tax=Humitalea sp. 24SJ18S-53 TaxID=3422307 RepID=UPI003D66BA7C